MGLGKVGKGEGIVEVGSGRSWDEGEEGGESEKKRRYWRSVWGGEFEWEVNENEEKKNEKRKKKEMKRTEDSSQISSSRN